MCVEGVQKPSKISKVDQASSAKSEDTTGISFLNETERLKVEKLLSAYQNADTKDLGIQTDLNKECVEKEEKGIQTDVEQQHLHENVLQRLESLEQKVESVLSLLHKVAATEGIDQCTNEIPQQQKQFQEVTLVTSNVSTCPDTELDTEILGTLLTIPVYHIHSNNPGTLTLPDLQESLVTEKSINECSPIFQHPTIPLPKGLLEETFKRSSSMANYAKNLTFTLFTKEELVDSNCVGAHNKKCLEADTRMQLIKDVTLKKYGAEDTKKAWGTCRKAIDSGIRKIRFNKSDVL